MKVFFIRHGETTGDVEHRYGGSYNDHLSPVGQVQSKALAETFRDSGIEVIYASPLVRAQATASYIANATGATIETVSALRERNQYGILSGLEKSVAETEYPDLVVLVKDRNNTIEGAESYTDFSARILSAIEAIMAGAKSDTIAVVSHGGLLRVLFRDYLQWGELTSIGDCSWIELTYDAGVWRWVGSVGVVTEFISPTK
jgi:broad specificity phosphatase PhoE